MVHAAVKGTDFLAGADDIELTLAEPVGSSFPAGASVEVKIECSITYGNEMEGTSSLMRMVDGGASVLIGELGNLRFSYWNEMGHETNQLQLVRRIVLEIQSSHSLA